MPLVQHGLADLAHAPIKRQPVVHVMILLAAQRGRLLPEQFVSEHLSNSQRLI